MAKKSVDEFRSIIEHAVDLEELETIATMLIETQDLTFSEKKLVGAFLNRRRKQVPNLKNFKSELAG
jgi:hypothetical protein